VAAHRQIIHIGVVKTGTTTLQNNVFSNLPGVLNIGRPYASERWEQAARSLRDDDDLEFLRIGFERMAAEAIAEAERHGKTLVLSDETFTRPTYQGLVAHRLSKAFPQARVLITIRSQFDLIVSYWVAHGRELKRVPAPYSGRHISFDDWFEFQLSTRNGLFSRFDVMRLVQTYEAAFGAGRVDVLLFEEMVFAVSDYANRLGRLLDADSTLIADLLTKPPANPRPSAARVRYQAIRSWLLPGRSFVGFLPGKDWLRQIVNRYMDDSGRLERDLTKEQRSAVEELFGSSNACLDRAYGLELQRWGYPGLASSPAQSDLVQPPQPAVAPLHS
jgi:hypothetical protein